MTKNKNKKLEDIPKQVVSNKECTQSPDQEVEDYLRYMATHHIDDLAYLWRHTQRYSKVGGAKIRTWANWKEKLRRDLGIETK